MYLEKKGNLLDYAENYYLVHQCNCKTTTSLGLARQIFQKYPNANTYTSDPIRHPGEINIIDPIINLYGQIYPGKAKSILQDGVPERLIYFKTGLEKIYQNLKDNQTINLAFAKYIGCGLAGGTWSHYEKILRDFEQQYDKVNILIIDFQ